MSDQKVDITAKFTKEQIATALITHFKLPGDATVSFPIKREYVCFGMGEELDYVFKGAEVRFKKRLEEI